MYTCDGSHSASGCLTAFILLERAVPPLACLQNTQHTRIYGCLWGGKSWTAASELSRQKSRQCDGRLCDAATGADRIPLEKLVFLQNHRWKTFLNL